MNNDSPIMSAKRVHDGFDSVRFIVRGFYLTRGREAKRQGAGQALNREAVIKGCCDVSVPFSYLLNMI